MPRNQNIFHLVLILAFGQISDASPKRPDGFLVKTKSGKTYLRASNRVKESLDNVNRNYRNYNPNNYDKMETNYSQVG